MTDLRQGQDRNTTHSEDCYANSSEHLRDELKRLDLLLQIQVINELEQQPMNIMDDYMGLVVSDEEVIRIMNNLGNGLYNDPALRYIHPKAQKLMNTLEQLNSQIARRREVSLQEGIYLTLPHLSQMFHLTLFDELCIVICLVPELDRKYEKLYSYLQDDITQNKPTLELILKLLNPMGLEMMTAREGFALRAPLLKYSLLKFTDSESEESLPLISRSLKLDNRIVNFLLDSNEMDNRLAPVAFLLSSRADQKQIVLAQEVQNQIKEFVESYLRNPGSNKENLLFYFYGPDGSGKLPVVQAVCKELGFPLIIADIKKLLEKELPFEEMILLLCREALLQPATLCFKNFDYLFAENNKYKKQLDSLLEWTKSLSRLTFLLGSQSWKPSGLSYDQFFIDVEFSIPDESIRRNVWSSLQHHFQFAEEIDFGAMASKFRFTPGQIQSALLTAQNLARWRMPRDGRITREDLYNACRSQSTQTLSTLGSKVKSKYTWNDIILPNEQMNQLRDIINQVKYRNIVFGDWGFNTKLSRGKGLNVLFSGPPGTGKTMAAEVIANELKLDLYKIDLSLIVSKYIGETEKNLQRAFDEAQASYAILFFDEADALFGKRSQVKDAHDRYANTEIAFLLQKMEEYDGITILTTNLSNNIDEAYMRRLQFNVVFPLPEEEHRENIWRTIFPDQAPKEKIDFTFLSRKFKFSGGEIKNIVLTAAFLAAKDSGVIGMRHIIRAIQYELRKVGKLYHIDDFGEYCEYVK